MYGNNYPKQQPLLRSNSALNYDWLYYNSEKRYMKKGKSLSNFNKKEIKSKNKGRNSFVSSKK
jgi:hypothetical protein